MADAGSPLERTPDMEGLPPSERARIYKERAAAAGIGRAPAAGEAPPAPVQQAPAQPEPQTQPPAVSRQPAAEQMAEEATAPPAQAPARPAPRPAGGTEAAPAEQPKPVLSEAEGPPEPEKDPDEIPAIKALVPDMTWERQHGYVELTIDRTSLLQVTRLLRDEYGYDYLSSITAVDWPDSGKLEVLYHLYGYDPGEQPGCLVLRVPLPREAHPLVPSLTPLWAGADFQEREVYDLMGIKFIGHPDLRRILLDDDFPGHPLRKDFDLDYEYVLVHHLRYGVEGQRTEPLAGKTTEYSDV